jgi:hypothetical protein
MTHKAYVRVMSPLRDQANLVMLKGNARGGITVPGTAVRTHIKLCPYGNKTLLRQLQYADIS